MNTSFLFGQVTQRLGVAAGAGVRYNGSYLDPMQNLVNTGAQTFQTYTVEITAATNDATYTFTVDGVDVVYTADSSTSYAEIGAGLIAAANLEGTVGALFTLSYNDSDHKITLTARALDTDVVVSDSDSKLTTVETVAPTAAAVIPFGRAVLNLGTFGGVAYAPQCGLCVTSLLAAQVDTLTVVYAASEVYSISIAVAGQIPVGVEVVADTNTATTTTAIVNAINARMPSNTVLAASSAAGTVTLTAEIPGLAFKTSIANTSGNTARLSLALTTATAATSLARVFAGIAEANYVQPGTTVGTATSSYAANDVVSCVKRGSVWVASSESVTSGADVYVETAAGDDSGKFFTTSSSTRLLVPGATWSPKPSYASGQNFNIVTLA